MRVRTAYERLGAARSLGEGDAIAIVEAARPHALAALGRAGEPPQVLAVSVGQVEPAVARGGSLIPAWPFRLAEGSVRIEFVDDWGAMLATWRASLDNAAAEVAEIDALLRSRERLWVGIANDVLQLFVPDPPSGTYSMVRHHGLMLAAATAWLGPAQAARWRAAHRLAASGFLDRAAGRPLWDAIEEAEQSLDWLLAASAAHLGAADVVAWLDDDEMARGRYADYLGAASLGVAALLEDAPLEDPGAWVERLVMNEHSKPDFNRVEIERLARRISTHT